MPTAKPRIQVSLTTSQYELISRLAKLQHRSRSAIVAEMWESIHPVLERVAVAMQAAARAQASAKASVEKSVALAEESLRPMVAQALGQLDLLTMDLEEHAVEPRADAAPEARGRARLPSNSRLVTRGSGRSTARTRTPARKAKSTRRGAKR